MSNVVTPISGIEYYKLTLYEHQFNIPTIYAMTTQLYYVFNHLEEFNNYSCEIAAVNRVGIGEYSSTFNFSTLQAGEYTQTFISVAYYYFTLLTMCFFQLQVVLPKMLLALLPAQPLSHCSGLYLLLLTSTELFQATL